MAWTETFLRRYLFFWREDGTYPECHTLMWQTKPNDKPNGRVLFSRGGGGGNPVSSVGPPVVFTFALVKVVDEVSSADWRRPGRQHKETDQQGKRQQADLHFAASIRFWRKKNKLTGSAAVWLTRLKKFLPTVKISIKYRLLLNRRIWCNHSTNFLFP